jgi:hypothetical protein
MALTASRCLAFAPLRLAYCGCHHPNGLCRRPGGAGPAQQGRLKYVVGPWHQHSDPAAPPPFPSSGIYLSVVILPTIGGIECESLVAFWAAC